MEYDCCPAKPGYRHVFAIVRIDKWFDESPVTSTKAVVSSEEKAREIERLVRLITVKKVVESEEEAAKEVDRLNQLETEKNKLPGNENRGVHYYFYTITRLKLLNSAGASEIENCR